jgi:hypothetical protein
LRLRLENIQRKIASVEEEIALMEGSDNQGLPDSTRSEV